MHYLFSSSSPWGQGGGRLPLVLTQPHAHSLRHLTPQVELIVDQSSDFGSSAVLVVGVDCSLERWALLMTDSSFFAYLLK